MVLHVTHCRMLRIEAMIIANDCIELMPNRVRRMYVDRTKGGSHLTLTGAKMFALEECGTQNKGTVIIWVLYRPNTINL